MSGSTGPGGRGTAAGAGAAGVVLAGGRSTRMGRDKADLPWRGTTLLGHVLGVLGAALDGPLVVVGAADRPGPRAALTAELAARVVGVADPVAGRGPLQGLATGLRAAQRRCPRAFVASVDLPHLHPAFVRAVLAALTPEVEVAAPVTAGIREPLAAAYESGLGQRAAQLLDAGHTRAQDLLDHARVRLLDAAALRADPDLAAADPGVVALRGVNTPDEFRAARGDGPGAVGS